MEKYIPLKDVPCSVLLDTDIGPDCDDAGALALLCSYAREYGFPILGVGHCTSNPYGAGCVDGIAAYCGYPQLNIGTWPGKGFLEEHIDYNKEVAIRFSKRSENGLYPAENAAEMYVRLLEQVPDQSVVMIAIGPLNNVAALLDLDAALVAKKVRALVCMAADIEKGREYNIVCDVPAAKKVFEQWPAPIYVSGFTLGINLTMGFEVDEKLESHPVYVAYNRASRGDSRHRAAFDLTAVDFAVLGEGERWSLTAPGVLGFGEPDSTWFEEKADGNVQFLVQNETSAAIGEAYRRRILQM